MSVGVSVRCRLFVIFFAVDAFRPSWFTLVIIRVLIAKCMKWLYHRVCSWAMKYSV